MVNDFSVQGGDSGSGGTADPMLNMDSRVGVADFEEKLIGSIVSNGFGSSDNPNMGGTNLEKRNSGIDDILHMIFRHVEQVHKAILILGKKVEKANSRLRNVERILQENLSLGKKV